jgi:galactokinase
LGEIPLRRCRHVIEENQRVLAAERALARADLAGFGRLMNASHASLRDLYEVSSPELDWLVERACATPGVCGSRLTGAGFGGCTVSLCRPEAVEPYRQTIAGYAAAFGRPAELLVTRAAAGARIAALPPAAQPSES